MKAFIKKINLEGDKVIWAIVLALSIFSILVVYSTAGWKFLFSHLIKLSIGLFFLYQVHKIKFKYFAKIGVLGFVVSIILLILVFIMGVTVNGASRWLSIAGFQFQPSDIAKLSILLFMARQLSKYRKEIKDFEIYISKVNKLTSNEWKQPFGEGNSSEKIVNDLIELSSTDTFNKHNRNDYAYDVSNAFKE